MPRTTHTRRSGPRPTGLVRAGNRAPDVVAFEDSIVGFFVESADILGVPKSVAAIYGICFASPEPLSFSEINDRLEISSGSISQGLRVLREVGALIIADRAAVSNADGSAANAADNVSVAASQILRISREGRGTRAPRYEPDLALRNLVTRFLEQRLESQLQSGRNRLDAIEAAMPAGAADGDEHLKDRLRALRTWHDQARAVLPLVKTFLKLT